MRDEMQIRSYLLHYLKGEPSEAGMRVAALLEAWAGLHHLDDSLFKKTDWTNPRFISVKLDSRMSTGQLSTYDFDALTQLVFLAHDHCIRVQLSPCNGTHFAIMFHPRTKRDGGMAERHPTLEDAVRRWRDSYPQPAFLEKLAG